MSVKSFKFVSPGVFVNEVDNSQLPRLPEDMGPVIIGRAERGPGMVPVKIESFSEFVETFGEPIAGGQADDAWRQGNRLGPTYGAFAAQAYLKNGSPITFVRLLGEANADAAVGGEAGWSMTKAWGIKVDDDGDSSDGHLAAIFYTEDSSTPVVGMSGSDIRIEIPQPDAPATPGTSATSELTFNSLFVAANLNGAANFKITIEKATGAAGDNIDVVFDNTTASDDFTSPTLTVGTQGIGDGDIVDLVEKIKGAINANLAVSATSIGRIITLVKDDAELTTNFTNLTGTNAASIAVETDTTEGTNAVAGAGVDNKPYIVNFDRNSKKYIRSVLNTNPTLVNSRITDAPETHFLGATFDQFIENELTGNVNAAELVALGAAYESHRASASPASTPWVRSQFMGSVADLTSDLTPEDLTKLFKIHTLYSGSWEQKNFKISITDVKGPSNDFVKYGTFTVLVRKASDTDASPVVYERFSNVNLDPTSSRYIAAVIGDMKMEWRDNEKRYVHVGEHANQSRFIRVEMASDVDAGAANPELLPFGFALPSRTDLPQFVLRAGTASDTKLSSPTDACFGITTDRPDALGRFDESYQDIVRPLHGTDTMAEGTASSDLFSLDLIAASGANATFTAGSLNARTSINGGTGATYESVLDAGFDKFTMPLFGAFDGLDIKEIEPFCDDITAGNTPLTNYAYNSISKAIDVVSDPEVVECNLMAIPGVATAGLTGKLVSICEARGDALAVIDLENDYKPRGWDTSAESSRLPQVSQAVSSLKARGLSSSYGCAFFPWVQVTDDINNRKVWMPPSVVALGTMASSTKKSELWFAPAGFTRGGLSAGAGGLPVSQVRLRLNSKERDALYEANINPIAQFPAEGIVVFGQKTLQVTPSALDRINVRRLMIHVKKEISRMAATTLFDQNVKATWNRFKNKAEPFLDSVQTRFGLTEYKIVLDETTTTPELIDRNIMYAKVFLKPARAIEFIAIDFVITNTGASFED